MILHRGRCRWLRTVRPTAQGDEKTGAFSWLLAKGPDGTNHQGRIAWDEEEERKFAQEWDESDPGCKTLESKLRDRRFPFARVGIQTLVDHGHAFAMAEPGVEDSGN